MGRHFDGLIELVGRHITHRDSGGSHIPNLRKYLEKLIEKASLFEFPLQAEKIRPTTGKDYQEYGRYLRDYFALSQDNGSFFITPFDFTAVEDPVSVVILDNLKDNEYLVTTVRTFNHQIRGKRTKFQSLYCAHVTVEVGKYGKDGKDLFHNNILPVFNASVGDKTRLPVGLEHLTRDEYKGLLNDVNTGLMSSLEQVVYIMDPQNFILRKENKRSKSLENNKSEKENSRPKKKRKNKRKHRLRKTLLRPHFTCLSEGDTKKFFRDKTSGALPVRPIRGHWKRLISERYKKMRGRKIYVPQYIRGEGEVETNGWAYEVMIKIEPGKVVSHKELKR